MPDASGKDSKAAAPQSPTARSAEDEKAQAQVKALLAKYHLDDQKAKPGEDDTAFLDRLAAQVKDKRAFLVEIMTVLTPSRRLCFGTVNV